MTPGKRLADIVLALVLICILGPMIILLWAMILIIDGRPVLYRAERMKTPHQSFCLWKFRTMIDEPSDSGVSAGYKSTRITRMGAFLRRTRLDELPQLVNILRGDISFVGPRPPLRHYVDMFPDLYAKVLTNRPGVTGLATLLSHRAEEHLLSQCTSAQETEQVYIRRCVPRKAKLDMIWAANRSFCFDMKLICLTVYRVFATRGR